MTRLGLALALAAVLLPATAVARDPLAGRVAGKPQDCVPLSSDGGVGGITILDSSSVALRNGAKLWRNVPIGQCTLRPLDIVIVDVFGAQLCRNDRFRTLTPRQSIPSAPCRLGQWVPYVKVK